MMTGLTIEQMGRERAQLRAALAEVNGQLKPAVLAKIDAGMSEAEVARMASVDRMTVRLWAGKRPWRKNLEQEVDKSQVDAVD